MNVVVLIGALSRDPEPRQLPSGDRLLSFDLTTRVGDERADSVPIAWFDPPDLALAAGDVVVVRGRVRRRFFRTPAGTQSRTEVVALQVVPARQRKRAQGVLARATSELATVVGDAAEGARA